MRPLLCLALAFAGAFASPARAQNAGPPTISHSLAHDRLESLRDTVPQADGYARWHERDEHTVALPHFPPGQVDGAVQRSAARARGSASALAFGSSVDGVGNGFSGPNGVFNVLVAPPDTVGAVGATQYVQIVNAGLAIFDKTTKAAVYGPVPTNTLWAGFGGTCETHNDGDAVVVFDRAAQRWVVSQFVAGMPPFLQCVAVSQTSDATGAWSRYAFSYGVNFPDYPKMGVWTDAYYQTYNMYKGQPLGAQLCAFDRAAMLAGAPATMQCFQLANTFGGVLPANLEGATAPPAGSPNYLVNFGANSLNLWKFHVDWVTPANTTLTGPTTLPVAAFVPACNGGACIPQAGVDQQLDSLGDRLMFGLAYRNFGAHEALVVNHAVTVGGVADPYTGVRWYEIRSPATTPVIFQQSTYAPDSNYRWMGSIAMDMQGNMALGYSVAGSTLVPAIRYTGRLAGDPAGMMQAETSIIEGSGAQGAQTGPGLDRWGDYSAMTIDPVDDCTFWYTNQYQKTTGTYNWSTRIATLAFPGCNAAKQAQTASFTSTAPVGTVFGAGSYTVTATATSGLPVALSIDAAASAICHLDGSASGSHVTFTGAGTCVVDANQQGDITYQPAPQAQQSFAIAKAAQTIAFNTIAPAPAVAGGATYQVLATATSALPVVLSVDASATSICTLDGSTTGSHVSFIHAGTCAINANQAGNANYGAAAQMQQSLNVVPGPPAALVFTTQPPAQIATGATLPTIAVSEQDSVGDVLDDNNSLVGFTIVACGASVNLGSATMLHGVATLNAPQRFFGTGSYQVTATSVALIGVSSAFSVVDNGGVVFANGYENCTL